MIHKQILDAAAVDPTATMAELADQVTGASTDLVERVLDEYGDPGASEETEAPGKDDSGDESETWGDDRETPDGESGTQGDDGQTPSDESEMQSDESEAPSDESETPNDNSGGADRNAEDDADTVTKQEDGTATDHPEDQFDDRERAESTAQVEGSLDDTDAETHVEVGDRGAVGDGAHREPATATTTATMTEDETTTTDIDDLDRTDRALLAAIDERPDATQAEIGEALGVSRATISRRVSDIDGLEWRSRSEVVGELFAEYDVDPDDWRNAGIESTDGDRPDTEEANGGASDGDTALTIRSEPNVYANGEDTGRSNGSANGNGSHGATSPSETDVGALLARVEAIESRLEGLDDGRRAGGIDDPELVHKVVHACMESDRVSEDEEIEVLSAFLGSD